MRCATGMARALLAGRRGRVIPDRQACCPSPFAETVSGALQCLSSIALSSSWDTCWIKRSMRRFI